MRYNTISLIILIFSSVVSAQPVVVPFCEAAHLSSPTGKFTAVLRVTGYPATLPETQKECWCLHSCELEIRDKGGRILKLWQINDANFTATWPPYSIRWMDDSNVLGNQGPMGHGPSYYAYTAFNPFTGQIQIMQEDYTPCQTLASCADHGTLVFAANVWYFFSDKDPDRLRVYRSRAGAPQKQFNGRIPGDMDLVVDQPRIKFEIVLNMQHLRVRANGKLLSLDEKRKQFKPE